MILNIKCRYLNVNVTIYFGSNVKDFSQMNLSMYCPFKSSRNRLVRVFIHLSDLRELFPLNQLLTKDD